MEQLKHECGIAMVRLLKPLSYYKEKYGSHLYGLNKLYLLMEKQHNRGQEGAGVGCLSMGAPAGSENVFRHRALGSGAIGEIFEDIRHQMTEALTHGVEPEKLPFVGELYMGHLRYSTTGRQGINFVHPFLRRNNWKSRTLMMCGNFNMTNVDEIFADLISRGQHPRNNNDTVVILEQLGESLDHENSMLYHTLNERYSGLELTRAIEENLDFRRVLERPASTWDGGYAICGIVGSGDLFVIRDPNGIRPAFYYYDDEIFVAASERPVIQTTMRIEADRVQELTPGAAVIVDEKGEIKVTQILPEGENAKCSFERIYFSRGSDVDIYRERKELGRQLSQRILQAVNYDLDNTILSFIPNTAETAFLGMHEGIDQYLNGLKRDSILRLDADSPDYVRQVEAILSHRVRTEKIAIKDIKLRTFITEGETRNELAAHVYDVTYGQVRAGVDNLVVIDDSIVRGTTLKQSITRMLDRLHPKKIVIVSSSPQVRYPDYYGIDMSRMAEFCAFRAAVAMLQERKMQHVLDEVYNLCKAQENLPKEQIVNYVPRIYEPFTDEDISRKIAEVIKGDDIKADLEIIFQTVEGLHRAIPEHRGDWYFSGNYPTPGGNRMVNQAYINWYEGNPMKR